MNRERDLEALRRMLRIRRFEEAAMDIVRKGQGIAGSVHVCIGQEAAVVGSCLALRADDYMVGYHRSHGHPIAKGAALGPLMAELMGRRTGVCHGKGGSMHLADFSVGSLGETAIVGAGIPQAVGAAYSARVRGTDQVALAFFGDGAANIGSFHEGLNLAAAWGLGAVFVCENNLYAMSTALADTMASESVAARAAAYRMPGVIVDGQDVDAVYDVVSAAVERGRAGGGPTLVEARTYRYRDHAEYGNMDLSHRPAEEVEHWRSRDPVELLHARLLADGISETELAALAETVAEEVRAAVRFAKQSPQPAPEELFEDLWATPIETTPAMPAPPMPSPPGPVPVAAVPAGGAR
ncbi:thiamine pyrophosphate-dependent dehydrogenase E1 component subunit alpha [Frankia sp. CNm7]|uniref:Thiamine pyrophosphate-dependent dehydrogenase E1 component subunit alpha n=1 Tax=Frankia nepalensis TaxID=1836974 RepID=A0A937RCV0_9ACTN|nr:thiamine pyrophosphate-dependent dehydrogenase E1 component subunit alpha [Frankia nepalensis]MBL7496791.1 thiamine pyrophosphate-dependent dehydrogenase E1 component subunit alpha [Frankia nepalensis]MBL7511556.1 thiamine pyrophosphate-dependent dehydrogenase E1 component subunit alpha [Frankia nepalensis]MBL7524741.1 thiamine pyrophosphate-dependent dehydrogenase E1 component subunit alpha [Frankia nepalensis]MBL7626650.1 thiamine pyrophosphate-dependent dehydrogenase E1 component subunit 